MTDLASLRAGLVLSILLTGLTVGGIAGASPAHACSCVSGDPDQQFEGAEAVFLGDVVSRERTDSPWQRLYTIEVTRVFKGDVAPVQEVVAVWDGGATCGIGFPRTGSVLIVGSTEKNVMAGPIADGQYGTWGCSGSKPATSAPASFGEGWPPETEEPTAGGTFAPEPTLVTPASERWAPFAVIAVVLVLIAGIGTALSVARRRDA